MNILFIIGTLAAFFGAPPCLGADDLLQYLEARPLRVQKQADGSGLHELYYASEPGGQVNFLSIVKPYDALWEVALHEFHESIGLNHTPRRATLVHRGKNGVPLQAEVSQNLGYCPEVGDEGWHLAYIEPTFKSSDLVESELNVAQLAQLLKVFLATYAMGTTQYSWLNIGGAIALHQSHDFLEYLRDKNPKSGFKEHFRTFPLAGLRKLSAPQGEYLKKEITGFLDRLEYFDRGKLNQIFEPAFRGLEEDHPGSMHQLSALPPHFKRIRGLLQYYLQERVGGEAFKTMELTSEVPAPPPVLPPHKKLYSYGGPIPSLDNILAEKNTKYLLDTFFRATSDEKKKLLTAWTPDVKGADPIEVLMVAAYEHDPSLHLVNSRGITPPAERIYVRPPQHFLTWLMPKTLVVFSPNDPEGILIETIVRESGKRVPIFAHPLGLRQGEPIDRGAAEEIASLAIKKYKRLLLCETRQFPKDLIEILIKARVEVQILDHHASSEGDLLHRHSTAEQLARIANYQLSYEQRLVAIEDRALHSAYPEMGFETLESLDAHLKDRSGLHANYAQNIVNPYRPDQDVIPVAYLRHEDVVAVAHGLSRLTYPEIANFIFVNGSSAGFHGNARVKEDLATRFSEIAPHIKHHSVGDGKHASRIRFRTKSPQMVLDTIVQIVEENRTGALVNPCAVRLAFKTKTETLFPAVSNRVENETEELAR